MFAPSQEEVRRFFREAWKKHCEQSVLTPMESMAADIIALHPEYHQSVEAVTQSPGPQSGLKSDGSSAFLHLSLHLAIEEQISIDQPTGLRGEFQRLLAKFGDRHAATHAILECLGETVWKAQREGAPPDSAAYLDRVRQR